ncbi:MAG: hypothetical protein ACW98F_18020 [Candidatus Hodarchaeales archaeon]|jgi:hypothetical protein
MISRLLENRWEDRLIAIIIILVIVFLVVMWDYERQNPKIINIKGDWLEPSSILDRVRYKTNNLHAEAVYTLQDNVLGWDLYIFWKNEVILSHFFPRPYQKEEVFNAIKEYIESENY